MCMSYIIFVHMLEYYGVSCTCACMAKVQVYLIIVLLYPHNMVDVTCIMSLHAAVQMHDYKLLLFYTSTLYMCTVILFLFARYTFQ